MCQSDNDNAPKQYQYAGITICHAAQIIMGGDKNSVYGCWDLEKAVEKCPTKSFVVRN